MLILGHMLELHDEDAEGEHRREAGRGRTREPHAGANALLRSANKQIRALRSLQQPVCLTGHSFPISRIEYPILHFSIVSFFSVSSVTASHPHVYTYLSHLLVFLEGVRGSFFLHYLISLPPCVSFLFLILQKSGKKEYFTTDSSLSRQLLMPDRQTGPHNTHDVVSLSLSSRLRSM